MSLPSWSGAQLLQSIPGPPLAPDPEGAPRRVSDAARAQKPCGDPAHSPTGVAATLPPPAVFVSATPGAGPLAGAGTGPLASRGPGGRRGGTRPRSRTRACVPGFPRPARPSLARPQCSGLAGWPLCPRASGGHVHPPPPVLPTSARAASARPLHPLQPRRPARHHARRHACSQFALCPPPTLCCPQATAL